MKLPDFIELVHRHAHRRWNASASDVGVSYSEFEYLSAIKEQEFRKTDKDDHGQHLQDVVETMGVRKASASVMVVKLEERGWVRRVPCQYDARAQHILLTEEGQVRLETGRSIYASVAREILGELGEKERGELLQICSLTASP
ncbi:MAG: MarR family winged helix-turn-helix transcriptional regulator [Roseibium sp.]|uniref:MarR family winged helix-turn-helix transcriptional regulator n=1 Tax=Roseibium sp. TaxID=1936156 RepID=UPI002609D21A|nr:MarR family winged helix-turn-helix transcriptional regulator [Roseibium sp.]MCV0429065.1 MarR family winged helix-turn-helix transcriptional regulator [Roseibium sp.]